MKIANKYCADSIESHARLVALRSAQRGFFIHNIRHVIKPPHTAASIFEMATSLRFEKIYAPIWGVILMDFEADQVSMDQLLDLGERGGRQFLGEAYYRIMLLGSDVWMDPSRPLSSRHRWSLALGWTKCDQEWDKFIFQWASDPFETECRCFGPPDHLVGRVSQLCANMHIVSADIIGRLEAVLRMDDEGCSCEHSIIAEASDLRASFKADLAQFFLRDPEHVLLSPRYINPSEV